MKRRELLLSSGGAAAVLLSGRVPRAQAQETTQETVDIERAIELLPAPEELDAEYSRVTEISVENTSEEELPYQAMSATQFDGVDLSDVDSIATAWTDDQLSIGAIYGSFDAPEPGEEVEEIGDWRIGDDTDDRRATASTDGMVVFVSERESEERIDAVEVGQAVGVGDAAAVVDEMDVLAKALDRLGDKKHFYYIDNLEFGSSLISGKLRTFSAGFEVPPAQARGMDGTVENAFFLEAVEDVDLDDETVEEILQEIEQGTIVDFETEDDGDFVFAETVVEAPPKRTREAAPDASIMLTSNPDDGTASFEHQRGESIPAEMLELWVNGELADTQPADEFDTFETGDSFTVDTGPLASVFLRWFDEDENQYYEYANETVGREQFETEYDPSAETVEILYTGETAADPDLLELSHRKQVETSEENVYRYETEQLPGPVDELGDTLENGDSMVVDDVEIQDRVLLDLDVPPKPPGTFGPDTGLVRYHVRQPRLSVRNRRDDGLVLRYYDDTARDAEHFRVLADGEAMETQPSDEHDTLEESDRVQLPDVEYGTKVVVEWTAGDEPTVVEEHVVTPRLYMEVSYDEEAGTVTLSHESGDTVEAGNLELTINGETAETQFGDEYDTVSQGDSLSVAADPFQMVKVIWSDGDTTDELERTVTGRGLFRGSYDPGEETVELVYTGTQTADASSLELRQYGGSNGGNDRQPFEDIDTLDAGDSVTIEDVGPEARLQVVVTSDDRRWSTVYRFTAQPRYAFDFENREGTLVAAYREDSSRDASEFRFLADGEELDAQPSEEHDTLEAGDEIELGSFEPGTTIVVQWPTSGEATQVQEHVIVPDATFAVSYDGDEGVLSIEHDGGNEIDADKLGVYAPPVTEGLADWDGDGTVSEGDSMTLEADEKPEDVLLVYGEDEVIDRTDLSE